jgi:predicted molibdopterin-dependent oxidoreductase YjgC
MPENIHIKVDRRIIEVEPGANLLAVCLANGIYIPHLCYLNDMKPATASCRLCFVEIEGGSGPVPACTISVEAPMAVRTQTSAVRRLQTTGLRLLLSVHRIDCRHCPANRKCELQRIAKFLGIGLNAGRFERRLKEPEVDVFHPCFDYYPNRCVLCGKCVQVCRLQHHPIVLSFVKRGFETAVGCHGVSGSPDRACLDCRACVDACPVAAIVPRPGGTLHLPGGRKTSIRPPDKIS